MGKQVIPKDQQVHPQDASSVTQAIIDKGKDGKRPTKSK
jgi:hypothetical protein